MRSLYLLNEPYLLNLLFPEQNKTLGWGGEGDYPDAVALMRDESPLTGHSW